MAVSKTYLVPVDFSKGSDIALKRALALARQNKGRLLLVHVVPTTMVFPMEIGFTDYLESLEKEAQKGMEKLVGRMRLRPGRYRTILTRGGDTARVIADLAKKSRASMIIMGSHGRTGLQKFMLGSVAERTLRYAECPVLIIKK